MGEEPESVDELRQRLSEMKRIMAERQFSKVLYEDSMDERIDNSCTRGIINGNFLSCVFGVALIVIVAVSIYAFYNLYHAVLKKFPSSHTEL